MPLFFLLLVLLLPLPVMAGEFHLNTSLIGQGRENVNSQKEIPVNGYLGMSLAATPWQFRSETDMRFFHDFSRDGDDYDLYQAVLHVKPVELLQIDFGRQFLNKGFSVGVVDGLQVTFMPSGPLDVSLYTGIPRSVEIGDFNKNDGLLSGLAVSLKNVARTHAQLEMAWQKNNIRTNNLRQNDAIRVGGGASHQFAVKMMPMIYGLAEYDVTGKSLDTGTAGLDLYPISRLALNLEFNYFDTNRSLNRPTLMSIFTRGSILSGRVASTVTIVPDVISFVDGYSYQNLEVQANDRRNGHLLDVGFEIDWDRIALHLEPVYYYTKSYGGSLHGGRLLVHEQFTDRLYAEASFDLTSYKKVTHNNDNATSFVFWGGYEVIRALTLSAGVEYNRNNLFTSDVRGSFRVDYHFDHGI